MKNNDDNNNNSSSGDSNYQYQPSQNSHPSGK
jgi:hypothetical protein